MSVSQQNLAIGFIQRNFRGTTISAAACTGLRIPKRKVYDAKLGAYKVSDCSAVLSNHCQCDCACESPGG